MHLFAIARDSFEMSQKASALFSEMIIHRPWPSRVFCASANNYYSRLTEIRVAESFGFIPQQHHRRCGRCRRRRRRRPCSQLFLPMCNARASDHIRRRDVKRDVAATTAAHRSALLSRASPDGSATYCRCIELAPPPLPSPPSPPPSPRSSDRFYHNSFQLI